MKKKQTPKAVNRPTAGDGSKIVRNSKPHQSNESPSVGDASKLIKKVKFQKVDRDVGLDGGAADLSKLLKKAKTHKGRKYLESKEPQVHEEAKKSLFLRGTKCSESVQSLLTDLHVIRKPFSHHLSRKQKDLDPFSSAEPLEYLSEKNDCALFCYGSTNKKRPFRLVMGRTFANQLLDMYEFNVTNYHPLKEFLKEQSNMFGSKPLVVCQGADFESSEVMKQARGFLMDFFSGPKPVKIAVNGLDHLITLTALPESSESQNIASATTTKECHPKILFNHYRIIPTGLGGTLKDIDLVEIGPSFILQLERYRSAEKDRMKASMKLPKEVKPQKVKNVSTTVFGDTIGRVHVGVQDFKKLHTPHHHGTKKPKESMEL